MPSEISVLEPFETKINNKMFRGAIVALKNGEIRFYNEKVLLVLIKIPEKIIGLKYGQYVKEPDNLVIITESGALLIKTLNKNVQLDVRKLYKFNINK